MKTESQIRQKVKQVVFRHRKEYVRRGLAQRPHNCAHNQRVSLPVHMSNRATLSICGFCPDGEGPRNLLCDPSMGGDAQAAECPYFQPTMTASALKAEFNKTLGLDGSVPVQIGYIAKEYPDLAALMWVIGPSENANTTEPPKAPEGNILALFGDGDENEGVVPERPLIEEDA